MFHIGVDEQVFGVPGQVVAIRCEEPEIISLFEVAVAQQGAQLGIDQFEGIHIHRCPAVHADGKRCQTGWDARSGKRLRENPLKALPASPAFEWNADTRAKVVVKQVFAAEIQIDAEILRAASLEAVVDPGFRCDGNVLGQQQDFVAGADSPRAAELHVTPAGIPLQSQRTRYAGLFYGPEIGVRVSPQADSCHGVAARMHQAEAVCIVLEADADIVAGSR